MASVNHSSLLSFLLLCVFSFASISGQLLCRDRPDLIRENCDIYFQKGGIRTILEDLKGVDEFDDDMRTKFLESIATVSDEYVILTVTSAQVVLTDVSMNAGMVEVSFFVLNPSGSTEVPTAFRSEELFLMMTLNDEKVETLFGQAVKPVDPNPETLPIPVWAIAILVYAAIVVVCAGALYATRDWRKLRQQNLERSLQMESVEKGYNNTNLPMTDTSKQNGFEHKEPIAVYSEAGVQTTPKFRAKAKAAKKAEAAAKAKVEEVQNTSNGDTTATIEKDAKVDVMAEKVEAEQSNTTTEQVPQTEPITVDDAGAESAKDTDPIVNEVHPDEAKAEPGSSDGVVNQAFDDDDQESDDSDGEQTYQITDIDQVDDDGNPLVASEDEDTAF